MEKPDTPAELRMRALRLLARREHSRAELARKLGAHAESVAVLDAILRQLIEKRQLSDERYAEARIHWLSRKYGAARIRQDLKAHGVAAPVADRVSSAGDLEKARAILARKYRTPATTREEKARRARFLQARGFSLDVVQALVVRAND